MSKLHFHALGVAIALAIGTTACDRGGDQPGRSDSAVPTAPPGAPPTGADPAVRPVPPDNSSAAPSSGPVAGAERAFVADAAANGVAEVEASRLVAPRVNTPGVKQFAERMERDHRSANEELQRIASAKGIDLPATPEGAPRDRLNRVSSASGPDLERTYIQEFGVAAHEEAIALFERQARDGQDPELRAFAERTLPTLREHLHMAQQLMGSGGGGADAGAAPGGGRP